MDIEAEVSQELWNKNLVLLITLAKTENTAQTNPFYVCRLLFVFFVFYFLAHGAPAFLFDYAFETNSRIFQNHFY